MILKIKWIFRDDKVAQLNWIELLVFVNCWITFNYEHGFRVWIWGIIKFIFNNYNKIAKHWINMNTVKYFIFWRWRKETILVEAISSSLCIFILFRHGTASKPGKWRQKLMKCVQDETHRRCVTNFEASEYNHINYNVKVILMSDGNVFIDFLRKTNLNVQMFKYLWSSTDIYSEESFQMLEISRPTVCA